MDKYRHTGAGQYPENIDQGDTVHLKRLDDFTYLVKVIVKSVTDAEVVGIVEAIFDYDSKMPLTGGHILELVNKGFLLKRNTSKKLSRKLSRSRETAI